MAARDPRYRPFRTALWAFYFAAIALALGIVLFSIVKHLRPHRPASAGAPPTQELLRACLPELEGLEREQNARAWRLGEDIGSEGAVARWETWARDWEGRLDELSDRCRLDAADSGSPGERGRAALARARDAVEQVHHQYRRQVVRFAEDQAGAARAAASALVKAREVLQRSP